MLTDGASAIATDILRLELSGPSQPHLTIVNLQGLIHSENKFQTAADIQLVQNMVCDYMANRRSIILTHIALLLGHDAGISTVENAGTR